MASLYDAMLDDSHWPAASALIEKACGVTGHALMVGEGAKDERRALYVGLYHQGRRREDLEREYLETYYPIDECVPRVRQLPDGRPVHVTTLYTAEELRTSPAYNEMFPRANLQNSLTVRLDGPAGAHLFWALGDPVAREGWGSSQIRVVTRLLPHIRQFVRVRQVLVRAGARQATVTALLENPRLGVVHLDRRGQIIEVNDRARGILRAGDGVSDAAGALRAHDPDDQPRFERLMAEALPASGAAPVGGWMLLRRPSVAPPFVVHVKPVTVPQPDYGARPVAALVLIVDPRGYHRVDPGVVAKTLHLTRAESQVAAWLAEGRSVREMAEASGRTQHAIYWHLKQIYQKRSISRQADLVRLVLSLAELE